MNELTKLQVDVDTPLEKVAEVWMKLSAIVQQAKEAKANLEEQMIAWIQANPNTPLEWTIDGDGNKQKFFVAHEKKVKCKDVRTAFFHLIQDTSIEDAADCLSSDAIKQSIFKKLLPDKFEECFETITVDKLKDGTPKAKELIGMNTRFVNAA